MASTDRDALVALYNATDGANWTNNGNWNSGDDLSQWHGIKVNDDGRVVEIQLINNNLQGSIPKELGTLTELTVLNLGRNELTGPIPRELGNLGALQGLYLYNTQLSGSIPKELGALAELTVLALCSNELITGAIPKELGALAKLEQLSLGNNKLTGEIPASLGQLSKLRELQLYDNNLSGVIPKELGALGKLEQLLLRKNKLTGSIPKELGTLTELTLLHLGWNQLTALWDHTQDVQDVGHEEGALSVLGGPVPSQLRRLLDMLDRLQSLSLNGNPWTEPPESIVGNGSVAIEGYFEDLYAEPCRVQRNSVKVIIVGQERAGKTSLRQSMKANKAAPTGEWKEESTVFADVEPMEIEGASVRVYDCAGQVAYTGLLQILLTPRSVCVLVCNSEEFGKPSSGTGGQVKKDLDKLEELCVCDWLRSISRRVPYNDVILVATKCDLTGESSGEFGRRMEHACRTWLASWVRDGMQPVRLEGGVCLTSCCAKATHGQGEVGTGNHAPEGRWACDWRDNMDEYPSHSLLHRLIHKRDGGGLRGVQMVLPRSWDIALTVLGALECGRDSVEMVVQKLANPDGEATETAETKTVVYQGIKADELSVKWQETVVELARRQIVVTNAKNALDGALLIREFDGSLVRHETFVFLDVVWLARILKPLLNHKDEDTFDGLVNLGDTSDTRITLDDPLDIASWTRLKSEGILEPRLAHAMWPAGLSKFVLPTLELLGLAFPLEKDPAEGLVVLLRLKRVRPMRVGKVIDTFCSENKPVFSARWKINLGVPAGAIEKVLTRCCSLGGVRTFWRSGVLVHGGFGDRGGSGTFAMVVEYSSGDNELTAQVYGSNSNPAAWAALSYTISVVRVMLLQFPGLRSRGSLECPQHGDSMPLANTATRAGDHLLLERHGCPQCSPETMGQGAAAVDLLRMADIGLDRGAVFDEVKGRFVDLEGLYAFLRPAATRNGQPENCVAMQSCLKDMKEKLESMTRGKDEADASGADGTARISGDFAKLHNTVTDMQQQLQQQLDGIEQQLGNQQGVLGGLSTTLAKVEELVAADDGVTDKVDLIVTILMQMRGEQVDTPRQACVLPPWEFEQDKGLSDTEQKHEVWTKRLQVWCETDFKAGKGTFKKEMRLFLVCANTHRLVPCGHNGQGYDIQRARKWIHLSVNVAKFALQVACSTLAAMAVPFLPATALGAAGEQTVEAALSALELQMEQVALSDGDGESVEGLRQEEVQKLKGRAYESLRTFVHEMEDTAFMKKSTAARKAHKRARKTARSSCLSTPEFVPFEEVMDQVQVGGQPQWVLRK